MAEITADELRQAQVREWSQYVAVEPIDIGGARAFNPGDPVPAGHVERGVVDQSQVAKTTTKAAARAVESAAKPQEA